MKIPFFGSTSAAPHEPTPWYTALALHVMAALSTVAGTAAGFFVARWEGNILRLYAPQIVVDGVFVTIGGGVGYYVGTLVTRNVRKGGAVFQVREGDQWVTKTPAEFERLMEQASSIKIRLGERDRLVLDLEGINDKFGTANTELTKSNTKLHARLEVLEGADQELVSLKDTLKELKTAAAKKAEIHLAEGMTLADGGTAIEIRIGDKKVKRTFDELADGLKSVTRAAAGGLALKDVKVEAGDNGMAHVTVDGVAFTAKRVPLATANSFMLLLENALLRGVVMSAADLAGKAKEMGLDLADEVEAEAPATEAVPA